MFFRPFIAPSPTTLSFLCTRTYALRISKLDANRICRAVIDPTPSIAAMTARIGLRLDDVPNIKQTFPTLSESLPDGFAERAEKGKEMLERTMTQFIDAKYPRMPSPIRGSILKYYTGDESLEKVARNVGFQHILHPTSERAEEYRRLIQSSLVLLSYVFETRGNTSYLKFVDRYFGVREFSWEDVIDGSRARLQYNAILKEQNKELLTMRLLNESGRQSPLPTFVVGAFSGMEKHGEGFGNSMALASQMAAVDALIRNCSKPTTIRITDLEDALKQE